MRTQPGLSLTYGLVEQLGQAIVTGEYADVGFPTEGELSKQFGASRTVTREAVKMLTAKGLLSARPRHGTVVAYLALFLALGGTAFAAASLPRNSVGTAQIRNSAVTGAKVRNHSLSASDFRSGSLPKGPAGPQGPAGRVGRITCTGKLERHDKVVVSCRAASAASVRTALRVRLAAAGGKQVATSAAVLKPKARNARFTLKTKQSLKRGTYSLTVTATPTGAKPTAQKATIKL